MLPLKILVVEDEEILRVSLTDALRNQGHDVLDFEEPEDAYKAVERLVIVSNEKSVDTSMLPYEILHPCCRSIPDISMIEIHCVIPYHA